MIIDSFPTRQEIFKGRDSNILDKLNHHVKCSKRKTVYPINVYLYLKEELRKSFS